MKLEDIDLVIALKKCHKAEVERLRGLLVEFVECPDCGFEYHKQHGSECASCECDELQAEVNRLRGELHRRGQEVQNYRATHRTAPFGIQDQIEWLENLKAIGGIVDVEEADQQISRLRKGGWGMSAAQRSIEKSEEIIRLKAEVERLREESGRRKNLLEQTEDRFSQVMMENDCLDALIQQQIAWLEGMSGYDPGIPEYAEQVDKQIAKLKKGAGDE